MGVPYELVVSTNESPACPAHNLVAGEFAWIAIFIVLRLLNRQFRDRIEPRHEGSA